MTRAELGEKGEGGIEGGGQTVNDTHFVILCCILKLSGEGHEEFLLNKTGI